MLLVPRTSGDGEIYARVVRAMYTDDQVVREAARRVVAAFPPGEQPPDFRVSDLYADLGKGGRFNSWMLADVEKVEGSVAGLKVWQGGNSIALKSFEHFYQGFKVDFLGQFGLFMMLAEKLLYSVSLNRFIHIRSRYSKC